MKKQKPPSKAYRSSITGKFVSKAYAEKNPDTTYATPFKRRKVVIEKETP